MKPCDNHAATGRPGGTRVDVSEAANRFAGQQRRKIAVAKRLSGNGDKQVIVNLSLPELLKIEKEERSVVA